MVETEDLAGVADLCHVASAHQTGYFAYFLRQTLAITVAVESTIARTTEKGAESCLS